MPDADDRFTEIWDAVDPLDPGYPHLWVKVEHLGRYLFAATYLGSRAAGTVLDAGCGRGYGAAELAGSCGNVLAIDPDESVLRIARQRYHAPNIQYLHAKLGEGELPQPVIPGSVDAAVCFEILEHLTDPARALNELHRAIRPGGALIVSVPNGVNERIGHTGLLTNTVHRRRYSIASLTDLLGRAGYEVTEILGQPLTNVINANEARLVRRKQTDARIGDEPAIHDPVLVRRMARAIGYPEQRDVELSYSIIAVARRSG